MTVDDDFGPEDHIDECCGGADYCSCDECSYADWRTDLNLFLNGQ